MKPHEQYPNLYKVCLEIAVDNGGINRDRPQASQKSEFDAWTDTQPDDDLRAVDNWIATLSQEELNIVGCGDAIEREHIMEDKSAPPVLDDILNDYFDEVC